MTKWSAEHCPARSQPTPPRPSDARRSGKSAAIGFSRDGLQLITAGPDKTVKLWDLKTRSAKRLFSNELDPDWSVSVLSPDRRRLAISGAAGAVQIWEISTGRDLSRSVGHTGLVRALAFAADDKTLVTGGADDTVRFWDVTARRELGFVMAHKFAVDAVVISPDGNVGASGGGDNTIRTWDLATRQPRAVIRADQSTIKALAFAADGKTLASAASQHAKFWNLASQRSVVSYYNSANRISAIAFAPDGGAMLVVAHDGLLRILRAPSFAETDRRENGPAR